jgi:hypothetical protein
MCDHGNMYVKKKDFYKAMAVVLGCILYASSSKKDIFGENIFTFMVFGYIFYFLFLTVKLRYQKEYKKILNDKNLKD